MNCPETQLHLHKNKLNILNQNVSVTEICVRALLEWEAEG